MISKAARETAQAHRLLNRINARIERGEDDRGRMARICGLVSIVALFGLAYSLDTHAATGDVQYRCDDNQTVTVNYIGAGWMRWDGKLWHLQTRAAAQIWRAETNEHLPAVNYEFTSGGKTLFWMTGQGAYTNGALVKPNSDDILFCEATK